MLKRTLGKTGFNVSVLSHGAMEIRGPRIWKGRPVTDDEANTILNHVLDAGINFIDTAWDYGLSETYIGHYIAHRRKEYYLATKCGCTWVDCGDHDETPHVWTRDNLAKNIEDSLKRMKTDYVDIWQLHNPSVEDAQREDLVSFMEQVQKSGKVRHISISSTNPHIDTFIEWNKFATFQIPYSALEREHEQTITKAALSGAGTIIRGGVARGEPGEGQGGANKWGAWEAAKMDELLDEGESRTAFQLRFTISHPHMHTTIVGTKNPKHLDENLRVAEKGPLPADVYEEAKKRLSAASGVAS